jgi:hypothetical protein
MTQALLVLGMHRSGTSAVAGCVERLGVSLGPRLVPGAPGDNERGFFEHAEVLSAHERFLAERGSSWDDPRPSLSHGLAEDAAEALAAELEPIVERDFATTPHWAIKDPRLCRLLPAWLRLLERRRVGAAAIIVVRHPAAVARSLARRNGFSGAKSVLLWLDHMLAAERATRALPRILLAFDALLADPANVLAAAGERLGLAWPRRPSEAAAELAAFASADLRHHRDAALEPGVPLATLAAAAHAAFERTLAGPVEATTFDRLVTEFLAQAPAFEPVLVEHLHQIARRASADRAWETERRLDEALAGLRRALDEDLSAWLRRLDEEVGRHGPELRRVGEGLTAARAEAARESGEIGRSLATERGERAAALAELERSLASLDGSLAAVAAGVKEAERALAWLASRLDALERPPRGLAARLAAAWRTLRGRPPGRPSGA